MPLLSPGPMALGAAFTAGNHRRETRPQNGGCRIGRGDHLAGRRQAAPIAVDTRTTLLDALRERLGITSPKKGCDHGQCGAYTVLLDGRRATTCLSFAVAHDESSITTAAGIVEDGRPHPVQRAFLEHDGFQCGYCTPGQVCSAVGMLDEAAAGWPSVVTHDGNGRIELTDEEIRERMSGNLCRCGAYVNIVAAIREVAGREAAP